MSEIVQPLRFCGVLCIARSVSQRIGRHAQLTRCFSAVSELLVKMAVGVTCENPLKRLLCLRKSSLTVALSMASSHHMH